MVSRKYSSLTNLFINFLQLDSEAIGSYGLLVVFCHPERSNLLFNKTKYATEHFKLTTLFADDKFQDRQKSKWSVNRWGRKGGLRTKGMGRREKWEDDRISDNQWKTRQDNEIRIEEGRTGKEGWFWEHSSKTRKSLLEYNWGANIGRRKGGRDERPTRAWEIKLVRREGKTKGEEGQ